MIYLQWALLVYAIWVVAGFWCLIENLGNKSNKESWWEKMLITGILPIAFIFGQLSRLWK